MRASRHGQNRVNTGVLQRCSFEESAYILIDSAYFSERDYLKGLTPNLMMGQISPIGTGVCELKIKKNFSSSSENYLRDSMEYITKKNMVTPRKERIRDGHEVAYRKRVIPEEEKIKMSLFLKNGGDATQSDMLQEYWKNNVSADNIINNTASASYIRTDAQTASVVTNLITGPKPLSKVGEKRFPPSQEKRFPPSQEKRFPHSQEKRFPHSQEKRFPPSTVGEKRVRFS